jgi:NAD(P)-binding Rossmann-like domain
MRTIRFALVVIAIVIVSVSSLRIPSTLTIPTITNKPLENSYDYIVIGSGIGGLSSAAMLTYYGYSVCVLESHDTAGGVAHTFEKDGFFFDSGPSLWNGMSTKPYNPLREILELVGEGDSVKYAHYDGWVMHVPEGTFKFTVGAGKFEPILEKFGGPNAVKEWHQLNEVLKPIQTLAGALPPLCLRSDPGVILTLFPHIMKLLVGAPIANKVEGPFKDISKQVVKDKFLVFSPNNSSLQPVVIYVVLLCRKIGLNF